MEGCGPYVKYYPSNNVSTTEGGHSLRPSIILVSLVCGASFAADVKYPQMIHWTGTRGMSQVRSAESLGEGFLSVDLTGAWHQVDKAVDGRTPPAHSNIDMGTVAVGLGLGPWADVSFWTSAYTVPNWSANPKRDGSGASGGQVQLQAPWDPEFPLRAGVQFGFFGGSQNQIQTGYASGGKLRADGWDYLQARTGYDLQATFIQTLRTGGETFPVRIHLNEGMLRSLGDERDDLVLLDAGVELTPVPVLSIGLEGHSRSSFSHFDTDGDPLWGTGTFTFHMPAGANIQVGGDLRFSGKRSGEVDQYSLDPWRVFGSLSFGVDFLAKKRRVQREAQIADSLEHERLANVIAEGEALNHRIQKGKDSAITVIGMRDSMAARLRTDSARLAQGLAICQKDGSSARSQVARMNDSLTRRSSQDSAALADARRQIEEERLKRGDLEASFLKTGMMNLDAVYFDLGKATITANSRPYLNLIGAILVKYPKLRFEVGGHTDNRGKPAANTKLSQLRALAVLNYFVLTHPELAGKVSAKGYGASKPKATNTTAEGREMNRRVEITVKNLEALKEYAK